MLGSSQMTWTVKPPGPAGQILCRLLVCQALLPKTSRQHDRSKGVYLSRGLTNISIR